jgi:hypothetical protein
MSGRALGVDALHRVDEQARELAEQCQGSADGIGLSSADLIRWVGALRSRGRYQCAGSADLIRYAVLAALGERRLLEGLRYDSPSMSMMCA